MKSKKCAYELAIEEAIRDMKLEDDLLIYDEGLRCLKKIKASRKTIDDFTNGFEDYKKIIRKTGDYDSASKFANVNVFIKFRNNYINELIKEVLAEGKGKKVNDSTIKEIEERIQRKYSELGVN